jgi:hypothetical protein
MGNCISNTGGFEPPGANAVAAFVAEYDRSVDPRWIAAEMRAAKAEEAVIQVSAALDQLAVQKAQALSARESGPPAKKAKKEKRRSNIRWKRCPMCSAMVELEYGCNQITTTCKEHFQAC